MAQLVDRRDVLMATGIGAAEFWPGAAALASDDALQTTTVRLTTDAGIWIAPSIAGERLLRDGFTDVQSVPAVKGDQARTENLTTAVPGRA
jgi:hypothetical protein